MTAMLYMIVEWIAKIHNYILRLNDEHEYYFTDKQLHFWVIGLLGMVFVLAIHPLFKWLAKHNHVLVITWIYVFTLIIVITFAIEIGQKVTNTGNMEFADIVMGVFGFVVMFFIFAVVRGICLLIGWLISGDKVSEDKKRTPVTRRQTEESNNSNNDRNGDYYGD